MAIKRTTLNGTDAVVTTEISDDEVAKILGESFSAHQIDAILKYGSLVTAPANMHLTIEGAVGTEAFIIVQGNAAVHVGGARVATVGVGQIIGEHALIRESRRNADVIANDELTMFAFTSREFGAVLAACPELSERVKGLDEQRSE